jgi:hypothetical protein
MWLRPEFVLLLVENGDVAIAESQLARCREIIAAGEDWRGLLGHVARAKAVVAAAEGKFPEAESQFETAVQVFQRYTLPWEKADALYYWGRALIAANLNSRASEKLAAANEIYRRHEAGQRWIDRIEAARKGAAVSGPTDADSVLSRLASFRQEADYCTLAYKSGTFRLKDSKGLRYIAFLIGNAGHELRADEVASAGATAHSDRSRLPASRDVVRVASDLGDTGVILDVRAKAEYRARMTELKAELADAEGNNDVGRVEKLRFEIDALERQLTSARARRKGPQKSIAYGACALDGHQQYQMRNLEDSSRRSGAGASP